MAKKQFYKIRLKPVGAFYFGNEQTLGDGNLNYFARSNYFPQQTTLLGMLRYRLLQMEDWLKDELGQSKAPSGAAEQIIGSMGFRTTQATAANFGAIFSLSPVFVDSKDGLLLPGALNRGYKFSAVELESEPYVNSTWGGINDIKRPYLPQLKGFDYKDPNEAHLMRNTNGEKLDYSDIFQDYDQVGITKKRENESDDKAFYKQTAYRFKTSDLAFVFWAELEQSVGDKLMKFCTQNPLVVMGGERSQFQMEVKTSKLDQENFAPYAKQGDPGKPIQVVLLSDARVEPEIYDECLFAISELSDFRYILTEQTTQNHYQQRALPLHSEEQEENYSDEEDEPNGVSSTLTNRGTQSTVPQKNRRPTRSVGYNLLSKGSVFYPTKDQLPKLLKKLRTAIAFRQIGYNAFVTIQPNGSVQLDYFHSNHPQNQQQ